MRIVLVDNQQSRSEQIRRVLLGEGLTCGVDDVVAGPEAVAERLGATQVDLVLIVADGAGEDVVSAIQSVCQMTSAGVLAAGAEISVDIVREVMRAGAVDFLHLDRLRQELSRALITIEATRSTTTDTAGQGLDRSATLISLFSPSGGAGVSTAAINLAVQLAGDLSGEVALLDLQPTPTDLALMLNIDPKHTTEDVCNAWNRLDAKMLAAAMTMHGSGIHVLAQAGYPEQGGLPPSSLSRDAVRQICTLARRMFAATVVDLGARLGEIQADVMRASSLVGLIVQPDVPGVKRAHWALRTAASLGVAQDRFRIVLNRCGQPGQINPAKIEEVLKVKVFQQIPEDHRSVNGAVNAGVPVTEFSRKSPISRSFSCFARSVQAS